MSAKVKAWRKDLRALLNTADGMLAQLREGDGLFFSTTGKTEAYDERFGKHFTQYGQHQTLYRVEKVERAKNGALRLSLAKPLSSRHQPKLPALVASCLCSRFVPKYGDEPPLLSHDPHRKGKQTRDLVYYKAYQHYDTPVPTLAVGVDLFGLSDGRGRTFESVEALQGAIDRYTGRVIARVRPGEVKVLLTNSALGER